MQKVSNEDADSYIMCLSMCVCVCVCMYVSKCKILEKLANRLTRRYISTLLRRLTFGDALGDIKVVVVECNGSENNGWYTRSERHTFC